MPLPSEVPDDDYKEIFRLHRPLLARLLMERSIDALVNFSEDSIPILRTALPYAMPKEATEIITKDGGLGEIEEAAEIELREYLEKERGKEDA